MYACSPSALDADEDVAGLHIAMDEPSRVRGVERSGDLLDELDGALRLEAAVAAEQLAQVGARRHTPSRGRAGRRPRQSASVATMCG